MGVQQHVRTHWHLVQLHKEPQLADDVGCIPHTVSDESKLLQWRRYHALSCENKNPCHVRRDQYDSGGSGAECSYCEGSCRADVWNGLCSISREDIS